MNCHIFSLYHINKLQNQDVESCFYFKFSSSYPITDGVKSYGTHGEGDSAYTHTFGISEVFKTKLGAPVIV